MLGDGHIDYNEFKNKLSTKFGSCVSGGNEKGLKRESKYASTGNIGDYNEHGPLEKAAKEVILQKRRMFPNHKVHANKGRANIDRMQSALKLPSRRAYTPVHLTNNLITPKPGTPFVMGCYSIKCKERFSKESNRISGNIKSYDYLSPDVYDKERTLAFGANRIKNMRAAMKARERPATSSGVQHDPNRRLRTVLKQRLNYHTMLESRLDADQAKRNMLSW